MHDGKIQTRFLWVKGAHETNSTADALRMLPAAGSRKLFSMYGGERDSRHAGFLKIGSLSIAMARTISRSLSFNGVNAPL